MNNYQSPVQFYKLFFWFTIADIILFMVLQFMQQEFQIGLGLWPGDMAHNLLIFAISMLYSGITTVAMVFFYLWVYRTCKNLYAFEAGKPKYSPGWSVGWFFIPVVNLVMPFLVMLEILKKSGTKNTETTAGGENKPSLLWIILWWALHLISLAVGTALTVFMVLAVLKTLIHLNTVTIPMDDLEIAQLIVVLAYAAARILLLRQITNLQESRFSRNEGEPVVGRAA
jgi:hypothetical protein